MSGEQEQTGNNRFASSETLGALSEALSKAQGEIEGARKDSANPFFRSRYADLASVWDACRAALSKHGLAVIQLPGLNDRGLFVDSILSHASGEWIASRLFITPLKNDPQGIGSAITYARRYGLQALVGIAPEDDDGVAAAGAIAPQQKREGNGQKTSQKTKPNPPAQKSLFNGPKHEALAKKLAAEWIKEEDLLEAAKFCQIIPVEAKTFRSMTDETASIFLDDPDLIGLIMKRWRERRIS